MGGGLEAGSRVYRDCSVINMGNEVKQGENGKEEPMR